MNPAGILSAFPPGERTVPTMLQRQARCYGSRPLFAAGDVSWSFAEAPAIAGRFAGTLAAAGIRSGDRVALMCGNRAEFMEAFLGCAWLGAIAVPLNVAARGPQLAHYLRNSGARLLIIEAELLDALAYIDMQELALERIWCIGDTTQSPPLGRVAVTDVPPRADAIAPCAAEPAQTLAILYTSGTTGPSKGVCCPHAQYFWWGLHGIRNLQIREGDVLSTTLPLFHTNALGTFHQALLSGSTLGAEPRFSASRFWQRLIERRATVTYLLGAMVPILLSREASSDEQSHTVRCALAPGVPANLHRTFEDRTGIKLLDGYGSTETNFVIGATADERRAGRMGLVREGFDARVVTAADDAPPGEPGELLVRSDEPLAFATGYFVLPDKTAEAFRDGWFHTGDRVVREADGYFRFVDRMKDAIRRRGENISSFEVEQVLLSHPDVGNAAVFPVPSELAEDEVMAAVVRRAGSALTERVLTEFCAPRLARFAVPRFIEFVDDLPTTENGKVQKYKLRDRGVTAKAWDREADAALVKR